MRRPELGFTARETAAGTYQFQSVIYVAARNGTDMMKTFDPHGKLLSEQETKQLGYNTTSLIERARRQRIGLPEFQWRHRAIAWNDLWQLLTQNL